MKHILIPAGRVVYVIICFAMLPIIAFFESVLAMWHWDKKYLIHIYEAYTQRFYTQEEHVRVGEMYFVLSIKIQ